MAMQTGVGLSKILILVGAAYTSTFLLKNGKLSDLLGELQSLVRGLEKQGDSAEVDPDYSDAIAAQVRRLAMEVQQLASARQITILSGYSSQIGNVTSFLVPGAALGALGYGYMRWKGFSFSDLMFVTKRNMANAVSNLTKHLEHVSEALSATKRHLTQQIENLDGKLDEQVEISKFIKNEVTNVRVDLSEIGYDMNTIQRMVSGLDEKIFALETKQDVANCGIMYLCNFVDGRKMKMPEDLQQQFKLPGKSCGYLTSSETPSFKGLKEIADSLESANANRSVADCTKQDFIDRLPRCLMRTASTKC